MTENIYSDIAEKVTLTILVDNKADLIVESTENIKYFKDKPLLSEHGLSVLIQLNDSNERILWDAGVSNIALMENLHRMEIDFHKISKIALSHGHSDHFTGMTTLLNALELAPEPKEWGNTVSQDAVGAWLTQNQIPLVAHPAAFRERWWKKKDGTLVGPTMPPPKGEWEAARAKVIVSSEPTQLGPGCWTTGYIPRKSFEHSGRSSQSYYRSGDEFLPDDLEDDQAIVIHVKGKGLIILSACAHSGIVNTINHAKQITGVDTVYAVIGGTHLALATDEEISQTIDFFKKENPTLVSPSHCTGLKAISKFAQAMPDQFVEGVVGMTYKF